jgi:hypothetical protein
LDGYWFGWLAGIVFSFQPAWLYNADRDQYLHDHTSQKHYPHSHKQKVVSIPVFQQHQNVKQKQIGAERHYGE